jgi:site-specific DNA-methyltransferase (adenine-specific)
MKIELADINTIKPYPNNPRKLSDIAIEKVSKSIKEFGFRQPIVVDKDRIIVVGHTRYRASKKLGYKQVPITIADNLTKEQINAYRIADNRTNEEAKWDDELLKIELKELEYKDFDLKMTGFDDKQINDLLFEEKQGLTDDDAVPDTPEEPITKLGDIWKLGNHRVMCGDSNNITDIDKLLKNSIPNAIVTDPPYGIGIDGQKKSIANNPKHNRKHHEFRNWDSKRPDKSIFNYIISLNVPTVIWGGNYFADLLTPTRGWIYWSKGQEGLTMSDGELAWTTENKPLRSKTVNRNALKGSVHPTQKPVDVINFSIEYLKVPEKGSVLDLFGGSGTTLISCEKSNKTSYIMELDPKYCDVIVKRWEQWTGEKATK